MKTSYLIRNTPWMNDTERRVARYTARRAEQTLAQRGTTPNALHATVLHTLVTARALHQRAQERLAQALAEGTATEALAAVIVHTQEACLRVEREVDALLNPPAAAASTDKPTDKPTEVPTPTPEAAPTPTASAPAATPAASQTTPAPGTPPSGVKSVQERVREALQRRDEARGRA